MTCATMRLMARAMFLAPLLLAACGGGGGGGGGSPATSTSGATKYTIGGTVTGHSDTVVLQNNGGNTLALPAGSASFVFDIGLFAGATYNVTLLIQPAGQTCSVANGTGTVSGANVTSVAVTCVANPTYTIGGSVSGLSGTVVLQNNGGDDLSLTTDGPFSFGSSLATGSGYNATILSQPAGQTCTIANSDGTVGSANIVNVQVSCATNPLVTYTVGGSISGLTGTVVLQNNGGDNLARTTDGVFAFATVLADGGTYNVSVFTQPAGQTCSVTGPSGSVSSANVTTVAVTCVNNVKSWRTATRIEANDGSAFFPQVAFDSAGNALAVWSQSDGVRENIWAARYTLGPGWGAPELIETNNDGNANSPQIAFDAADNAIAVWSQSDGTRYSIWANRYIATTGWETAVRIHQGNADDARSPQIAINAAGNALVVWQQFEKPRYNIWANRFTAGSGWGTAVRIETDDVGEAINPQVAVDAAGNGIAVWQHSDISRYNIVANRYTAGAGWGTAELIESNDFAHAVGPRIAMNADGKAVVVWQQQFDASRYDIVANRYDADWGTAAVIEMEGTHEAVAPHVAIDADGNVIAVWSQFDGSRYNIMANRYTTIGGAWGVAERIETDNLGSTFSPQIAFDTTGNAFAVWHQSDGVRTNIWANRYVAGAGWNAAAAEKLEDGPGNASFPRVAVDANGNAFAVWHQSDDIRYDIWVNRYD